MPDKSSLTLDKSYRLCPCSNKQACYGFCGKKKKKSQPNKIFFSPLYIRAMVSRFENGMLPNSAVTFNTSEHITGLTERILEKRIWKLNN